MGKKIVFRCVLCKHYYGYKRCAAFRERIPVEIYAGNNDHSKPLNGQKNDIIFEPEEN